MTMTKDEMIGRICEKTHLSKDDGTNIIEATFEVIKASLERGEEVKIKNFGIFSVRAKKARRGRNPQTGAEIVIPGHKTLTFKPSPAYEENRQSDGTGLNDSHWTKVQ